MSRVTGAMADDAREGGDPACWLERVCDDCGALIEGDPAAHVCRAADTTGART